MGRIFERGRAMGQGRRAPHCPQYLSGAAIPPFGFAEFCAQNVDGVLVATNNTILYVTVLSLNTGIIPLQEYRVAAYAYYSQNDPVTGDCQIQVLDNGIPLDNELAHTDGSGVAYGSGKNMYCYDRVSMLAAGAHTLELQLRVANAGAGDIVCINWCRINVWSY